MEKVKNLELNRNNPANILNAPKIKYKIPTLSPPPLFLNESNCKLKLECNCDQSFSNENTNASECFDNEIKSNLS